AWREDGLVQTTCRLLKKELPEMVLITDGALDPYHDSWSRRHY
ncbi:hypothetical protein, partial [Streptococcus agalactiae]